MRRKIKLGVVPAALLAFWALLLDHIPPGYIGVAYNRWSGQVVLQEAPGWYLTAPSTQVMRIDARPMRVTVISLANTLASKLIRFRKEGVNDYLERQGFGYMIPFRQKLIMVGYAYSGETYPFLDVLEDSGI